MIFYIIIFLYLKIQASIKLCNTNKDIKSIIETDFCEYKRNSKRNIMILSLELNNNEFDNLIRKNVSELLETFEKNSTKRSVSIYIKIVIKKDLKNKSYQDDIEMVFNKIFSYIDGRVEFENDSFVLRISKFKIFPSNKLIFGQILEAKDIDIDSSNDSTDFLSVLHIFLFEEMRKNSPLKNQIRKDFIDFIEFLYQKNLENDFHTSNKILMAACFKLSKNHLANEVQKKILRTKILEDSILNLNITVFKNFKKMNKFYYQIIKTSLIENKKFKEKNENPDFEEKVMLSESIKMNNNQFLKKMNEIMEYDSENFTLKIIRNTGELTKNDILTYMCKKDSISLNFIMFFSLKIKDNLNFKYNVKINVKKIPKKHVKEIIITDDDHIEILNLEYEIDKYSHVGFPPSKNEMIKLHSIYCNNENSNVKKFINFVKSFESIILGKDYLYFRDFYNNKLNLDVNFCFYKNEVYNSPITNNQIKTFLENINNIKNKEVLSSLDIKKISIFTFKKCIFLDKEINIDHDIFKNLKNHYFYSQELRFYSEILEITGNGILETSCFCNFFIKVECLNDVEHLIVFKPEISNHSKIDDDYDQNKYKDLLQSFFDDVFSVAKKNLSQYDHSLAMNNFHKEHFKNLKHMLYDQNFIYRYMCEVVKEGLIKINTELCFNDLFTKKWNEEFPNDGAAFMLFFNTDKDTILKNIMEKYLFVCRESYKKKEYIANVISSLSDVENHSSIILYNLFNFEN